MVDGMDGQGVILDEDAAMQEEQAARDRKAMQARQDELTRQLASLSEQAAQLEASTTRRINAATATIMNEARKANEQLGPNPPAARPAGAAVRRRADRRARERGARPTRCARKWSRIARPGPACSTRRGPRWATRGCCTTRSASLPHERFAPGQLARLTDRLAIAEASVAAGTGETALAQAQELYLSLGELRAEVELKDAEWRAAHQTAVAAVTALAQQISYNSMITVTDEESGASAELDVDYWSDGELSAIKKEADQLTARVNAEADPPTLAELRDISERSVVALDDRLSEVVATARTRQWASQVRVNMAETVVDVLESITGYAWDGDATFAGDDQREAFYSKLRHPDDSEIVVEVAPDEDGKSCVVRVMSYETGNPDESQRVARVHAVADSLREQGLSGTLGRRGGRAGPGAQGLRADPAASGAARRRALSRSGLDRERPVQRLPRAAGPSPGSSGSPRSGPRRPTATR